MCENGDLKNHFVSVVIPIKNEEKYINKFLKCLTEQTYSKSNMEFIFCDGNSIDKTLSILKKFQNESGFKVIILNNEKQTAPSGVNLGIKNAKGDIILRLDAHTIYPKEYIEKNIYYLENSDADNVGCPINTVGKGVMGKAIAHICSSRFGVGNSKFRISNYKGYVDTVPFGCFRKELIDKIGYFDENLPRSEDNDFNYRIRKYGGKVLMFSEISTEYHSRTNISEFCKMGINNGKGIIDLFRKEKKSISIRHLIPLFFVLGNIMGLILSFFKVPYLIELYFLVLLIYFILDIFYSFIKVSSLGFLTSVICIFLFPIFHLCYGIGSLIRIVKN